jgi:acetyl-CoA carboxylase biotin carboxyl carrier protein
VTQQGDDRARTIEERLADHAEIERVADQLLPVLVAKLAASGLAELEVREDAWRVRLRLPGDARTVNRPASAGVRAATRTEMHASMPTAGSAPTQAPMTTPMPSDALSPDPDGRPARVVATSPAVGFFRPRPGVSAGNRVRAGDPVGAVDVLGVPQDVVVPADGIVGASLVEPGDPVEYGQEIMEIVILDTAGSVAGDRA